MESLNFKIKININGKIMVANLIRNSCEDCNICFTSGDRKICQCNPRFEEFCARLDICPVHGTNIFQNGTLQGCAGCSSELLAKLG